MTAPDLFLRALALTFLILLGSAIGTRPARPAELPIAGEVQS